MMLTDKPNLQFRVCNIKRRMLVPLDETTVRSKHYVLCTGIFVSARDPHLKGRM
jgi:hypothetical protein